MCDLKLSRNRFLVFTEEYFKIYIYVYIGLKKKSDLHEWSSFSFQTRKLLFVILFNFESVSFITF